MPRIRFPAMAENMICLWKPAQSGKTRTIQEIIRSDRGMETHLNIIICSNNRGLVAQTRARMHNDMVLPADDMSVDEDWNGDDAVIGGVYSWMSGTKRTNVSARDLALRVLMNEVSMVVCCSHKARFRYIHELLTLLERASYAKPVNVWIDEADVSVRYWAGEFNFSRFRSVMNIYPVSATFGSVFDYYERIRVKPFPETHPWCYRGLADCELVEMDAPAGGAAPYIEAVLAAHPEVAEPGMRLFVPGDIERVTHDAIARSLTARGFIVLVLNGVEKAFRFPDGRVVPIEMAFDDDEPVELSKTLADAYEAYGMKHVPFAVTGQLCLGRGITFQSRGFLFDVAILPAMTDDSNAYQCAARVLGNTADFDNGDPVTVYLTPRMRIRIERQERIAMNIARLVHEEGWVDVGEEEVGLAAGDPLRQNAPRTMNYRIYRTEAEARAVLHKLSPEYNWRSRSKHGDFFWAAVGRKAQKNSLEHVLRTLPNLTGGAGETAVRTMWVPCYLDTEDANTLRYVIPVLPTTSAELLAEIDTLYPQV
jgi:hypothetical protein